MAAPATFAVTSDAPRKHVDLVREFEAARREAAGPRRVSVVSGVAIFGAAVAVSADVAEFSPGRLLAGLPSAADYILRTLPVLRLETLGTDLADWYWGLGRWLPLLFDTVVIALLGTVFGAAGAALLCFVAARNMHRNAAAGFAVRRLFELARTVPEVVYALMFVYAFGLGAMPGVLALAVHSFGALGKLFSEVVESVDRRSIEGVRATGACWPQEIRYGVLPQVLPNFTSYALLRFELNVRSASVVGFVGAGGIGQELLQVVRQFILPDVSAIVLLVIATVMVADVVSGRLRHAVIRGEDRP